MTISKQIDLSDLFKETYPRNLSDILPSGFYRVNKSKRTVQDWIMVENISETDRSKYPNAREAYEIQQSPLFEALK